MPEKGANSKMVKKILCVVIAILFFANNFSYGLGVRPGSNDPSIKGEMYAAAQRLFAAKVGPGSKSFDLDNIFGPGKFIGEAPEVRNIRFSNVKVDYENLPEEWKKNEILKKTDLIDALRYYMENNAQIPGDRLDIIEGYFLVDEAKGELPLARIEKHGKKYVLVVHTKFVQMWNHIRIDCILRYMSI